MIRPLCALLLMPLVFTATPAIAAQQPATKTEPCAGPPHRATDYILGQWRVVQTTSGKHYAQSSIEQIHDGCAVRDTLRYQDGTTGGSITFFKPIDGLWHVFYHDSVGNSAHLTGVGDPQGRQEIGGDILFAQLGDKPRKVRQITQKDELGRPRQIGYILSEKDASWHPFYDLTFCPVDRNDPRHKPPC